MSEETRGAGVERPTKFLHQLPTISRRHLFRLEWFWVDNCDEARVFPRAAVWHERSKFRDVLPDYHCDGADFVQQWHLFIDGRSTGRSNEGADEFGALFQRLEADERSCPTQADAVALAIRLQRERVERKEQRLLDAKRALADLVAVDLALASPNATKQEEAQ